MSGDRGIWGWLKLGRRHQGIEALSEYLDGRLDDRRRGHLEVHLASCRQCREELATLTATKSYLSELPQVRVPRPFYVTAVQQGPAKALPFWYGLLPGLRLATSAAAALFVAVVATSAMSTFPSGSALRLPPSGSLLADQEAPAAGVGAVAQQAKERATSDARPGQVPAAATAAAPVPGPPQDGVAGRQATVPAETDRTRRAPAPGEPGNQPLPPQAPTAIINPLAVGLLALAAALGAVTVVLTVLKRRMSG